MRNLARTRRAVVIVEFAVVLPLFLTMLLSIYDFAELLIVQRRLAVAANEVAEIGTNLAMQPDNTNYLYVNWNGSAASGTLFATLTAPFAYFSAWLSSSTQVYSITLSSIAMQKVQSSCTSSCSYEGEVAWSIAISYNEPNDAVYPVMQNVNLDTSQERPCGQTLTATAPTPTSTPTTSNWAALRTLPTGVLSSAALLVADVSTTYHPMFLTFLTGPIPLFRTGFMPPRIGSLTQFIPVTTGTAGYVTTCSGYATVASS